MIILKAFYPDEATLSAVNKFVYTKLAPDSTVGVASPQAMLARCTSFIAAAVEAGHAGEVIPLDDIEELIKVAFPELPDYLCK